MEKLGYDSVPFAWQHESRGSEAAYYRSNLRALGVDCSGINDVRELKILFDFASGPEHSRGGHARFANDSSDLLYEKFPGAARQIRIL